MTISPLMAQMMSGITQNGTVNLDALQTLNQPKEGLNTGLQTMSGIEGPKMPGVGANGAQGGIMSGLGGLEGVSSILGGIGSLGQAYASIKGLGLAREQMKFQKEAYRTNLANQTQSYNTRLEDRTRARYHTEGRSGQAERYLDQHRL